jgi:putative DNA primase/helicase
MDKTPTKPKPTTTLTTHPNLIKLSDVKPEPVRWLWPGRIPLGKVTLIVGDPGLGKSFITNDIAARVTRDGATWPDAGEVPHGNVVILSSEDSPGDTIRPRIEAMGGDVNRVHVLRVDADGLVGFDTKDRRDELASVCATGDVRLLIFDPLASYLGSTNTWKDSDVRRVMDPLAVVAAKVGVAIIGIMHLTKATDRSALHRASGSMAFPAASRAAYIVMKHPDDDERRVIAPIKFNIGPKPSAFAYRISGTPAVVQWDPEPLEDFDVDAAMAKLVNNTDGSRERREAPKLGEALVFLREFLAAGPRASKDVMKAAKAVGITEQTLRRAAEKLAVKQHNPGTGQLWELPSQPSHQAPSSAVMMVEGSTTKPGKEGAVVERFDGPAITAASSPTVPPPPVVAPVADPFL